jgi:hypothetical protein
MCQKYWERTEEFLDLTDEGKLKEECSLFTKLENNKNLKSLYRVS